MRQVFQQRPWIYPEELDEVKKLYYKYGRLSSYKKGTILKSGGESQRLFHLVDGLCAYFINYAEGRPRSFALILPGRSMADLTSITGMKVNVTTITLRTSKVLTVPPYILLNAIKENSSLAVDVCRLAIAKQECSLEATITNFTYEPNMRLKVFMKALISEYQNSVFEWNELPIIFTHEELGMMIDTTRVTVSRLLSNWEKEGLVRRNGKRIIVHKSLLNDIYDWIDT